MSPRRSVAVLPVALALAGCGALGPESGGTVQDHTAPLPDPGVAHAERAHEFPTPAPAVSVSRGRVSALTAVRAFATEYVNWDASTVVAHLRLLAAASVGQARSAMQLAAGEAARDYDLRRGGVANHGTVEAVSALAGAANEFVVVTRESTTATATNAYQGLRPAWHVSLATVTKVEGLWVLDAWQPES